MNVLTSLANFLAFGLENINISQKNSQEFSFQKDALDNFYNYLIATFYQIKIK